MNESLSSRGWGPAQGLSLAVILAFLPIHQAFAQSCASVGRDSTTEANALLEELSAFASKEIHRPLLDHIDYAYQALYPWNVFKLFDASHAQHYYSQKLAKIESWYGASWYRFLLIFNWPAAKLDEYTTFAATKKGYVSRERREGGLCDREIAYVVVASANRDEFKAIGAAALLAAEPFIAAYASRKLLNPATYRTALSDLKETTGWLRKAGILALVGYPIYKYGYPFIATGDQLIEQEGKQRANQFMELALASQYEELVRRAPVVEELPFDGHRLIWDMFFRQTEAKLPDVPHAGRGYQFDLLDRAMKYRDRLVMLEDAIDDKENLKLTRRVLAELQKRKLTPEEIRLGEYADRMIAVYREQQFRTLEQWVYYQAMYPEFDVAILEKMKAFGFFVFGQQYKDELLRQLELLRSPHRDLFLRQLSTD